MSKNHEPSIWTRIGWHLELHGSTYVAFGLFFGLLGSLVWAATVGQRRIDAERAAQQACVLHGKVPAEVFGKIVCIDPEALR